MLIFLAIAIASFILIAGSFLFGHDHDTGHADAGHADQGADVGHDAEPTIGFFSVKVLATLTMGFGAAGAIARNYGADYLVSSLIGLLAGIVLSLAMYAVLRMIYAQQASSLVATSSAVGQLGVVDTSIPAGGPGEVSLTLGAQHMVYIARSATGAAIARGRTVKVVGMVGSELVVEEVPR